jgi:hypothetical protein
LYILIRIGHVAFFFGSLGIIKKNITWFMGFFHRLVFEKTVSENGSGFVLI